jgi:hypothetical protein
VNALDDLLCRGGFSRREKACGAAWLTAAAIAPESNRMHPIVRELK